MVPMTVTDEQIKSLAHCHDQSRFPAAVWMHPRTKAILLRSSAIKSRTANSLFKHNQQRRKFAVSRSFLCALVFGSLESGSSMWYIFRKRACMAPACKDFAMRVCITS